MPAAREASAKAFCALARASLFAAFSPWAIALVESDMSSESDVAAVEVARLPAPVALASAIPLPPRSKNEMMREALLAAKASMLDSPLAVAEDVALPDRP